MIPYREQIDEIMRNFDFVTVAHMLQFPLFPSYNDDGEIISRHPWKMFLDGNRFEVPNLFDLMNMAEKLLTDVSKHSSEEAGYVHCGCFKAINWYGRLGLEFIVENYTCEEG